MNAEEAINQLKELEKQPLPQKEPEAPEQGDTRVPEALRVSFYDRIRRGQVDSDDIPEEIREDWTRSVLGDIPFTYTVKMLGGRVGLVFSELDKERSALFRKLTKAIGDDLDAQTKLCIVLFLREVTGDIQVKFEPSNLETDIHAVMTAVTSVDKAYEALCNQIPVGLSKMLFGAWAVYSSLVGLMTQDAYPDSF